VGNSFEFRESVGHSDLRVVENRGSAKRRNLNGYLGNSDTDQSGN